MLLKILIVYFVVAHIRADKTNARVGNGGHRNHNVKGYNNPAPRITRDLHAKYDNNTSESDDGSENDITDGGGVWFEESIQDGEDEGTVRIYVPIADIHKDDSGRDKSDKKGKNGGQRFRSSDGTRNNTIWRNEFARKEQTSKADHRKAENKDNNKIGIASASIHKSNRVKAKDRYRKFKKGRKRKYGKMEWSQRSSYRSSIKGIHKRNGGRKLDGRRRTSRKTSRAENKRSGVSREKRGRRNVRRMDGKIADTSVSSPKLTIKRVVRRDTKKGKGTGKGKGKGTGKGKNNKPGDNDTKKKNNKKPSTGNKNQQNQNQNKKPPKGDNGPKQPTDIPVGGGGGGGGGNGGGGGGAGLGMGTRARGGGGGGGNGGGGGGGAKAGETPGRGGNGGGNRIAFTYNMAIFNYKLGQNKTSYKY